MGALTQPDPPVPTSAAFVESTGLIAVSFDKPLAAGSLSSGELVVTGHGVNDHSSIAGSHGTGSTVVYGSTPIAPTGGPDRLDYLATSSQLVGTNGAAVAAFANFPITVT